MMGRDVTFTGCQPGITMLSTTVWASLKAAARRHCHVNELSPLSSFLSPDLGTGQQARLAFPDPDRPSPTLAAYHDGLS